MIGAALSLLGTFVVTVPWGERLVRALLARGIGKNIRPEEPDSHRQKQGTATMGGVLFLGGGVAAAMVLALAGYPRALVVVAVMVAYGLLGAYDDVMGLRDREGIGWLARGKFAAQWGLALLLGLLLYAVDPDRQVLMPLTGRSVSLGLWYVPVAAFWIVFLSNGVNLADGMDGLAGGTTAIAFAALAVLARAAGQGDVTLIAAALVGALLAFLWHNAHPARIFMGDTGSQALGAGLAAVAMLSGHWLVMPVVGAVFVAEALSVMVQVAYFRHTRLRTGEGRRVFRRSPLHYHYLLGGLSEVQVTQRFWIAGIFAALCGLVLAMARV